MTEEEPRTDQRTIAEDIVDVLRTGVGEDPVSTVSSLSDALGVSGQTVRNHIEDAKEHPGVNFADIGNAEVYWYESDDSGVVEIDDSCWYTYEHIDTQPEPEGDLYMITSYVEYSDKPIHKNSYFVSGSGLNEFFTRSAATGEVIVDVRPITQDAAASFRRFYQGGTGE